MTDKQVFSEMLTRAGIEFTDEPLTTGGTKITVLGGYIGFFTEFDFDSDGNLLEVGAYE